MLEFLFKFPLQTHREGSWVFESGWSLAVLFAASIAVLFISAFMLSAADLSRGKKISLWLLQGVFAVTTLFMFWRPALQVEDVKPGENAVTLMIDSSSSMRQLDGGRATRLSRTLETLTNTDLIETLDARFSTSVSAFNLQSSPVPILEDLEADGVRTELLASLKTTLERARQKALAGVVLISDGSDNGLRKSAQWWRELASFQVPIYTIGVGNTKLPGDLELGAVQLPSTVGSGASIPVRVAIQHDEGGVASLKIFDGDELLRVDSIELPAGSAEFTHQTTLKAADAGVMDLRFEVVSAGSETLLSNNSLRRILPVSRSKQRVLYLEGEPRWEFKFMRRALHDYSAVELVSLLRTSPNKFYRQGVSSPTELQNGFPLERSELFTYDAVIIGSIEASHLSAEQQRDLRDFVRIRGGSLLMLAGKNGLSDGGWGRSEVARALPAELALQSSQADRTSSSGRAARGSFVRERRTVMPTRLGEQTSWLSMDDTSAGNLQAWSGLPQIADYQKIGPAKPGASVLLEAFADGQSREQAAPLLLWQRYGRGKSYMMATSGTWRWQMGLPASDQRHEEFWQGFMGHLVSGVLPRLSLQLDRPSYTDTADVELNITLRDENFELQQMSSTQKLPVKATLQTPAGEIINIDLVAVEGQGGQYKASFQAPLEGDYRVDVSTTEAEPVSQSLWFIREDERAEEFSIRRNNELLQRVALETGGEFLELSELSTLPDLLRESDALVIRNLSLPLWNMPVAFLLLLLTKFTEWGLRWRWGRI